jgi:hypothetical protein
MSLTSYRTAPPRDDQKIRGQRTDHGGRVWASGGKRVVTGAGGGGRSTAGRLARRAAKQQPARRGGVRSTPGEGAGPGSSVFRYPRPSVFCLLTPGSTWRRPALPPLPGAVPWARRSFTAEFGMGSGGTSALWPPGRARSPAEMTDDRGQKTASGAAPCWSGARLARPLGQPSRAAARRTNARPAGAAAGVLWSLCSWRK